MARQCTRCENDMGYPEIHDNLHTLFLLNPELEREDNNVILMFYWIRFDYMLELQNNTGVWPKNAGAMTSMQRIDREIRNILHPSKKRRKSREMEQEVRANYAWNNPIKL